jgi:hypothetical protein
MTTGDLYDLAVYCEAHDAHDGVAQGAIWAETDSATADDLEAYGLTTTELASANSMYKSVTGESIEGAESSTTGTGDTSGSLLIWIIIAVATTAIVVVALVFLLGKRRNQAGGQNGAYYPQKNLPYPPNQSGYPQNNQPYQRPYQPNYPQQGMTAQVPPGQPPMVPPQQPAPQALNVVSFCPNCGMKTDGRSLSCPNCGWYLGKK